MCIRDSDSNGISIDGKIDPWYQDDIALRCQSYGWHVIDNVDGHQRAKINSAIEEAKLSDKPTMIVCKTSIGYGAGDKQDSEASHGAALGEEAMTALRKNLDWPYAPFEIDEEIYDSWNAVEKGTALEKEWDDLCKKFSELEPDKSDLMQRLVRVKCLKILKMILISSLMSYLPILTLWQLERVLR